MPPTTRRDERLADLIDRWEELRASGRRLSAEELGRGVPELIPQLREWIAMLEKTSWLEQSAVETAPSSLSPPEPASAAKNAGPRILGDYEILEPIGAGGMGQVFKAQHRSMRRFVAIKLLPPAVSQDTAAIRRFEREVHAAAKLLHPNIVAAFDAGCADGAHFLVMEYVPGRDLESLVRQRGPLSVEKSVDYTLQAARGLAYAHSKEVVHRDIKPGNLILDEEGTVKILDMGLARIDGEMHSPLGGGNLTQSGAVMGTLDYMAPEQAVDTHQVDGRADLYSLGCTLYRLLTGRAMYGGETIVQKIMAHREAPIPDVAAVRTDVPAEIANVYRRLVAKRPEDRYPSANDLIADLEHWKSGRALPPPPPPPITNRTVVPPPPPPVARPAPRTTPPTPSEAGGGMSWHWLAIGGGVLALAALGTVLFFNLPRNPTPPVVEKPNKPAKQPTLPLPTPTLPVPGKIPRPAPANSPFTAEEAKEFQADWARYLKTEVGVKTSQGTPLILIPPGEFVMGAMQEEVDAIQNDTTLKKTTVANVHEQLPRHVVRLTRPYRLGATEVTVGQFREFVIARSYKTEAESSGEGGSQTDPDTRRPVHDPSLIWSSPGYVTTEEIPVTQVTWNDAVEFCNWLSHREKLNPVYIDEGEHSWRVVNANGYRLPTEAEWEFACRAGTTTTYYWGHDPLAAGEYEWCHATGVQQPQRGGQKKPNPFGLYDLCGNVKEWINDWHEEDYYAHSPPVDPSGPSEGSQRLQRSGPWMAVTAALRSAHRTRSVPERRYFALGFRLARTVEGP